MSDIWSLVVFPFLICENNNSNPKIRDMFLIIEGIWIIPQPWIVLLSATLANAFVLQQGMTYYGRVCSGNWIIQKSDELCINSSCQSSIKRQTILKIVLLLDFYAQLSNSNAKRVSFDIIGL